jgi:hypothetical protein
MKTAIHQLAAKIFTYTVACILFPGFYAGAQQAVTAILTENITSSPLSYTSIKGAGLRNPSNVLISSWDSTGSFTVNYNAPAVANILRLNQFSVASFAAPVITMPLDAIVKLRRASNADVGDARNYYNFWAQYSSIPAAGSASGIFNFTAPQVVNPENAFLLNNLTSGYDNIFQNTIANPHFGNIERIDFIVPAGLHCSNNNDRLQSGVVVIDRGTGDPFKIAAITAIDATNKPTSFGNLVSVTAANFGVNLLPAAINYSILINDVKYYSQSRPSTQSSQNLKGVYISLADLGMAIGQHFYGYAMFGPDVLTAAVDWTTYPNNTSSASQLDPVNIMGLYKSSGSVLPLPIRFTATRVDDDVRLKFTLYNEFNGDYLVIQHSGDGIHFNDLKKLYPGASGEYTFIDNAPAAGNNYYRLQIVDKTGNSSISEIRIVRFESSTDPLAYFSPTTHQLTIHLSGSWLQSPVTAEIFTATGQLITRTTIAHPADLQSIAVSSYKPGIYFLRLLRSKDLSVWQERFRVL